MNDRTFIDSNTFLYAVEDKDPSKAARAGEWLRALLVIGTGIANLQVMNEITNVLTKRARMKPERIFEVVDGFLPFGSTPINLETVAAARLVHFEHRYAWWDCLLLASAMELGCRTFLSEDMKDGHQIRGLTIMNPFLHTPPQLPLH